MNSLELWDLLDKQEAQWQYLSQGHFRPVHQYLNNPASPMPEVLRHWLSSQLLRPVPEQAQLPEPQRLCWQGWLAYQQGDYSKSIDCFGRVQSPESAALRLSQALGLGRVLTRTGHWHAAQGWLLHALQQARNHNRLHDLMRAYGALSELLLRAGWAREALFCMKTAYRLLPPGAGERPRQLNYLASILLRLGQPSDQEEAEHLLMSSYYLSQHPQDLSNQYHALARLQYLELDRGGQRDVQSWLSHWPDGLPDIPVALGHLCMGRGQAAMRREERVQARSYFEQAQQHFAQGFPGEARWAALALATLNLQTEDSATAVQNWPPLFKERLIPQAPESNSPLDYPWARLSLPHQGLGILEQTPKTRADLDTLRTVFFL